MSLGDYQSALVTGASGGIGAAVVRMLRGRGLTVYAAARREERLTSLAAETGCEALVLDVCDSDSVHEKVAALGVDIVVNNAGMGRGFETLLNASPNEIDEVINTNVGAAIHVVRAAMAGMVERKRGHIVNVGSVAGLYPLYSSLYGASKGAIHRFNQCLRLDLRGTGVRNTEICPSRVQTEFFQTAFRDDDKGEAMYEGFQVLQPQDIAASIEYALSAPWHVNVSMIEITATEQTQGGLNIDPVER